eukprot:IDg1355t1
MSVFWVLRRSLIFKIDFIRDIVVETPRGTGAAAIQSNTIVSGYIRSSQQQHFLVADEDNPFFFERAVALLAKTFVEVSACKGSLIFKYKAYGLLLSTKLNGATSVESRSDLSAETLNLDQSIPDWRLDLLQQKALVPTAAFAVKENSELLSGTHLKL